MDFGSDDHLPLSRSAPDLPRSKPNPTYHPTNLSNSLLETNALNRPTQQNTSYSQLNVPYQHSILLAHDLNHERQVSLERRLERACSEIQNWEERYRKLKTDFEYNLRLIEGRDKELTQYEREGEERKLEIQLLQQKISRIMLDDQCQNLLHRTKNHDEIAKQQELERQVESLKKQLAKKDEEKIESETLLRNQYENKMKEIQAVSEAEIQTLNLRHAQEKKELELRMGDSKMKLEKFSAEMESWKRTIQTKEAELSKLTEDFEQEKRTLRARNLSLEQEKDQIISTYQVQIDRLVSKIETIQETEQIQESRNAELVEENKNLTEQIQGIQKNLRDRENNFEEQKSIFGSELHRENSRKIQQLQTQWRSNTDSREAQLTRQYESKLRSLEVEREQLRSQIQLSKQTGEEKLNSATSNVKKLLGEVEKHQLVASRMETRARELELELESNRKSHSLRCENFENEKLKLLKEIERSSSERHEFFKTLLEERDRAINELREFKLKINLSSLESSSNPSKELQDLQTEIVSLKRKNHDLEQQEKLDQQNALTTLQTENKSLRSEQSEFKSENEKLESAIQALTQDMDLLHSKTMGTEYNALHDSKLELERKVEGLVRYCDLMQRQLKEAITGMGATDTDSEISSLRDQVCKAHEIIRRQEKDLQKRKAEMSELHSKLHMTERLELENADLRSREAELKTTIRQLRETNVELMRVSNRRNANSRIETPPPKFDDPSLSKREVERPSSNPKTSTPPVSSNTDTLWQINDRLQAKLDKLSGKKRKPPKRHSDSGVNQEGDLYDDGVAVWLKHKSSDLQLFGKSMGHEV